MERSDPLASTAVAPDGDSVIELRAAVGGLVWHAGGEEAIMLAGSHGEDRGTPTCWSASATIAHTSEFRAEQIARLVALREHRTPPDFDRIDHDDPVVYERLSATTRQEALDQSRSTTVALVDELNATPDQDLLDPARNPWLRGRQLWLQIVVRGFWHPLGHVGEYYLRHDEPERALALHAHALLTARYLNAPDPALGMASYSLACTQAVCDLTEEALGSLREAIALNSDLREAALRDPDLERVRSDSRLEPLLASR